MSDIDVAGGSAAAGAEAFAGISNAGGLAEGTFLGTAGGAAVGGTAGEDGQAVNPELAQAAAQAAAQEQVEAVRQTHWQDFVRNQQAQHSQEVQQWRSMTTNDPEIGGDRLSVSVARAQWALSRFDPNRQLGQWMEESGLGNHPEVIRFFNRIADAVGEDVVVDGRVAREMPSLEERMYPHWKV